MNSSSSQQTRGRTPFQKKVQQNESHWSIGDYNQNHAQSQALILNKQNRINSHQRNENQGGVTPSNQSNMTQFQTLLIARNMSPQGRKEQYQEQNQEAKVSEYTYHSQSRNDNQFGRNFNESHENYKIQENQNYLKENQNRQSRPNNDYFSKTSPVQVPLEYGNDNSNIKLRLQVENAQAQNTSSYYQGILNQPQHSHQQRTSNNQSMDFDNLPSDYKRIIQDIEDRKAKSKLRNHHQPNQQPQSAQTNNYLSQKNEGSQRQRSLNTAQTYQFNYINDPEQIQFYQQQNYQQKNQQQYQIDQVNLLESLYHDQALQRIKSYQQPSYNALEMEKQQHQQILNTLLQAQQQQQRTPQNTSNAQELLSYYTQKFNLQQQNNLPQSQQQYNQFERSFSPVFNQQPTSNIITSSFIQKSQQQPQFNNNFQFADFNQIQQQYSPQRMEFNNDLNNKYSSPQKINRLQIPSQPIYNPFQSPNILSNSNRPSYLSQFENLTPPNIKNPQQQQEKKSQQQQHQQRFYNPPINISLKNQQQNVQDINDYCNILNKQVVNDFESKSFSTIQNKYKNLQQQNIPLTASFGNQQLYGQSPNILDQRKQSNQRSQQSQQQQQEQQLKLEQRNYNNLFILYNHSASKVQKFLKGYLIRKHYQKLKKQYYFFKRAEKKIFVRDLIRTMKDSFIQIKTIKNALLKNYVDHCATKIQKVFRGYYARETKIKIKKAFYHVEEKLIAVIQGWRIRRIMKTKEIETYVVQISDYRKALREILNEGSSLNIDHNNHNDSLDEQKKEELVKGLQVSMYNTSIKMSGLIQKMVVKGLWVMYKQLEKKERKQSGVSQISVSNANTESFKVNRNNRQQKSQSSYKSNQNTIVNNNTFSQNQNQKKNNNNTLQLPGGQATKTKQRNSTIQKSTMSSQQQQQNFLSLETQENARLPSSTYKINKQSFQESQSNQFLMNTYNNNNGGSVNGNQLSQRRRFETSEGRDNSDSSLSRAGGISGVHNLIEDQNVHQITTYNQLPIKSYSKDMAPSSSYKVDTAKFQPNFKSDQYKEQAKESFQRRMNYDPRKSVNQSKERPSQSPQKKTFSPAPSSSSKNPFIYQKYINNTNLDDSLSNQNDRSQLSARKASQSKKINKYDQDIAESQYIQRLSQEIYQRDQQIDEEQKSSVAPSTSNISSSSHNIVPYKVQNQNQNRRKREERKKEENIQQNNQYEQQQQKQQVYKSSFGQDAQQKRNEYSLSQQQQQQYFNNQSSNNSSNTNSRPSTSGRINVFSKKAHQQQ